MELHCQYVHSEHLIIFREKRQVPISRLFLHSSEHNGYYVYCWLILGYDTGKSKIGNFYP